MNNERGMKCIAEFEATLSIVRSMDKSDEYAVHDKLPFVPTDTSEDAANSFDAVVVRSDERRVLDLIGHHEVGMTDDELEVISGMSHQTVSARRNGLVRKGLVRDSGFRRATRSGRQAIVWVLGQGRPTDGAPNARTLRPSDGDIADAEATIGHMVEAFGQGESEALRRVRTWLRSIS